jgi:hypothetical protein
MKSTSICTILMTLSLGVFSATVATAQSPATAGTTPPATTQSKDAMAHNQMMMANEPHHILAMAYHQNLLVFTKALQEQTASASSVNVEFARAAVAEMRHSFDQMKEHHQDHVQAMSPEMHSEKTMQEMETHQTELNTALAALEQEVQLATPDVKKVSTLATSVHTHLDAMSKLHEASGSEMKAKM